MADNTNYGLLNNMTQGIREGMITYTTLKNQNRMQQLQEMQAGVQQDQNGNYQYTPEMQAKRQAEAGLLQNKVKESQHQASLMDASTPESQSVRESLRGLLGPGHQDAISDNLSGTEAEKIAGTIGTSIKSDATTQALLARLGAQNDQRKITSNLRANKEYDSQVGPYENQIKSAAKIQGTLDKILNSNGDLTSNKGLANDLASGLASMVTGKPATVYGAHQQEFDSMESRRNQLIAFIKGETPNTLTRDQLMQLKKDVAAVDEENRNQHETSYQSLRAGLDDTLTPKLDSRFSKFRQLTGTKPNAQGGDQTQFSPDVVEYARQHGISPQQANQIKMQRTQQGAKAQPQQSSGGLINSLFGG